MGDVPTAGEQKTGQDEGNQPEGEFTGKRRKEKKSEGLAHEGLSIDEMIDYRRL